VIRRAVVIDHQTRAAARYLAMLGFARAGLRDVRLYAGHSRAIALITMWELDPKRGRLP
jgi:hypothetical protein